MADFNNLLGEIDELERYTSTPGNVDANADADGDNETESDQVNNVGEEPLNPEEDNPQQQQQRQGDDNDDEDNDNDAQIPTALVEAERARRLELSKNDNEYNGDGIQGDNDGPNNPFAALENNAQENNDYDNNNDDDEDDDGLLLDADYDKMRRLWIQELNATELLPHDDETMSVLMGLLSGQEQTLEELQDLAKGGGKGGTTGSRANANVDPSLASLAASICKMDSDRLSFLVADMLRTRLFKLETYALHNRDLIDRMSQAEVSYLRQYGELFEKHMQRSVTNHLPKDAWKKLDEPEMIDRPDMNSFVFCRVLDEEGVSLDNNVGLDVDVEATGTQDSEMEEYFKQGAQIFARYAVVRDLILEGKVELMM